MSEQKTRGGVLITFYCLLIIILSLFILVFALRIPDLGSLKFYMEQVYTDITYSAVISLIALFLLALSIGILSSLKSKQIHKGAILKHNELGTINVSMDTINSLALRTVKQIKSVREVKSSVRVDQDGLVILLRIRISADTNIPELSQNIQSMVSDYVEEKSGVRVKEINVDIDNIVDDMSRLK